MTERRYNDEEVAAIFARASEEDRAATQHQLPSSEGMTLVELQSIGREAGISPERVALAARSLEVIQQPVAPKFLGLPLNVARTVRLERRLTDAEWEQLVVDLRETFDARGTVRVEGSLRSWANGNLHVLVEPDGDGQRIRFKTRKAQSQALMLMGLAMTGSTAAIGMTSVLSGAMSVAEVMAKMGSIALIGAVSFTWGALQLPAWAKRRQLQMEGLAERLKLRA